MDLNLFATQIVQTGGKSSSDILSSGDLLGGANSLGAVNADFWNVILGNLAEEQTEFETKTDNQDLESAETIKKETVDLALLQLALLGQDPDINIDEKLAELKIERQALSQENRVEQLTKLIQHLTSGIPDATNENTTIEDLVSRLTKRLESLEASLDTFRTGDFGDGEAPFKLLIATGLNPAQLTKITNRIDEVETKLGRELTVEDLIAGVGNIIPAPGDDDHEFSTTDAMDILLNKSDDNEDLSNPENEPTDELAAKLNNIDVGGADKSQKNPNENTNALGSLINLVSSLQVAPAGTPTTGSNNIPVAIPAQLSNAEYNALFGATNSAKKNLAKLNIANLGQNTSLPNLQNMGDISLPANWTKTFSAQATLSDALGFDIQTGTPFSSTMMAAHSAASVPQAGQTHPATQMVAAYISKAAQTGDTKGIILKLDPPELGRVEVRLEFGKEKSVKAHLTVEKPETLLMLQRDASALERALQNAGLETDSGSLNYGMAQDGFAANSDNGGRGQNGANSGTENASNSIDDNEEIIETTLTWDIDPETGHTRYNLLA